MAPLALQPRGAEALAQRRGRCRLCSLPIRPGDPILETQPIGWTHVTCGDSYRAVLAEHGVEEVER